MIMTEKLLTGTRKASPQINKYKLMKYQKQVTITHPIFQL